MSKTDHEIEGNKTSEHYKGQNRSFIWINTDGALNRLHPWLDLSPSSKEVSCVEVSNGSVSSESGLWSVLSEDDAGISVEAERAVAHARAGTHEGVDAAVVQLAAEVERGRNLTAADLNGSFKVVVIITLIGYDGLPTFAATPN